MKIDPQTLKSLYSKMPEEIKDIFSGIETGEKLARIGKNHGLNVEQVSKMTELVGLVLLGINRAQDLIQNVSSELKIDTAVAGKIATDINTDLFMRVREALQQIHEKNKEVREELGVKEPTAAPQPVTQAQQSVPPAAQTATPQPTTTTPPPPVSAFQPTPTAAPSPAPQIPATPPPAPPPTASQLGGQAKEDILKEIEDKKDELPAIFRGMTTPTPFEAKTGDGIFRSPAQTTDYSTPPAPKPEIKPEPPKYPQGKDPYRELPE